MTILEECLCNRGVFHGEVLFLSWKGVSLAGVFLREVVSIQRSLNRGVCLKKKGVHLREAPVLEKKVCSCLRVVHPRENMHLIWNGVHLRAVSAVSLREVSISEMSNLEKCLSQKRCPS